ncbi:unnamed protein product [Macrosiphum euphorbiae]|uniref:Uncharacterized protein n=1 Tax=Macrosiphum euphorbiae TaxID=13131 RepID=A0AAV0XKB2_9HEMI|nr:unnamed protein product [Macrosiphum euphorbiae]
MRKINLCKKVDTARNRMHKKHNCLKVYLLASISPPPIRRLIFINLERQNQKNGLRNKMYRQMATISRLKSRKGLFRISCALLNDPSQSRINAWKDMTEDIRDWIEPGTLTYSV